MRPEALCGLLAEPARLKVYSAVVLGATMPSEIAAATGLPARDVVKAVKRLEQGGLLIAAGGTLTADVEAFKTAVRASAATAEPVAPMDPDAERDAVLRAFIVDGRLTHVPSVRGKRLIVLEHLAACFEPGVKYPERAVNTILRAWHEDYAALRRYLIDEQLLSRGEGLYWRIGGPVEM